jgi:hypothetical protein
MVSEPFGRVSALEEARITLGERVVDWTQQCKQEGRQEAGMSSGGTGVRSITGMSRLCITGSDDPVGGVDCVEHGVSKSTLKRSSTRLMAYPSWNSRLMLATN